MRRLLALTLLSVPTLVGAQGLQDAAVIVAPHFTQYNIGSGAAKKSITQMAIPLVFVLPFTDRFSVDVTTAYATSDVKFGDSTASSLNGLTDTQIRANLSFGGDFLILTAGVNIPTGQYTVPEEDQVAAGQIGNDFLNYPISSMGNGFAGTGGIAIARPVGSWNIGAGASFRKSTRFTPFSVQSSDFRFTPADEYRVRLGADRPVGSGQVSLGLSYSAFGADATDSTTYSTGDRITATGMWMVPVGDGANLYLSGWNLYRLKGQQLAGDAPSENVANLNAALSFSAGEVLIQPSVEGRLWQVDGARSGQLFNLGARVRFAAGRFSIFPAAGYSFGTIWSSLDPGGTDVTGMRGSLTIRFN